MECGPHQVKDYSEDHDEDDDDYFNINNFSIFELDKNLSGLF